MKTFGEKKNLNTNVTNAQGSSITLKRKDEIIKEANNLATKQS